MPQLPQIDSLKAPDRAVAQATRTRRFPWLNLPFVVVVATTRSPASWRAWPRASWL